MTSTLIIRKGEPLLNFQLFFYQSKLYKNFTTENFVGRAGFEPAKFTQQIYSLPSLAA